MLLPHPGMVPKITLRAGVPLGWLAITSYFLRLANYKPTAFLSSSSFVAREVRTLLWSSSRKHCCDSRLSLPPFLLLASQWPRSYFNAIFALSIQTSAIYLIFSPMSVLKGISPITSKLRFAAARNLPSESNCDCTTIGIKSTKSKSFCHNG